MEAKPKRKYVKKVKMHPMVCVEYLEEIIKIEKVFSKTKLDYVDKKIPTGKYEVKYFVFDIMEMRIKCLNQIKILKNGQEENATIITYSDESTMINPLPLQKFIEEVFPDYLNKLNYYFVNGNND